jgi:PAS domain S-box-containing protein
MTSPVKVVGDLQTRIDKVLILIAVFWTTVIIGAIGLDYHESYSSTMIIARAGALDSHNKDLIYRKWATMHGGVYVPVTPDTPPSPYLEGVSERDVTTPSGKKLTLMNPAYMNRQVHMLGATQAVPTGHVTSLKPIRPENAPDEWERKALLAFENGKREVSSLEPIGKLKYLRFMRPIFTDQGCLKCHESQGYKVGDVRGGISVAIPWRPTEEALFSEMRSEITAYAGIWLIGILGLFGGRNYIKRRISDHKRAAGALQESEGRFKNFLNATTDMAFIKDDQFRYLFANQQNQDFFGLSENEIFGKTDFDLMQPQAAETCRQSDQLAIAKNDIVVTEEQVADRIYELRKFPVLIGSEKVGIGGLIRDITERKQDREALQESEQLFRRIFEHSPVGKTLTTPDGKLLKVNQAFADMLGYTIEELQQRNFSDITSPEDMQISRECIRCLLTDEQSVYRMEKRYLSKSGNKVWVDLSTTLLRDSNGAPLYFLTTILDITYKKQAQAAIKESEFRLSRAELVAGLGNWEIDLATGTVTASNGARTIYGAGQEELTLHDIQNYPLQEYRPLIDEALQTLITAGTPYDVQFKIKRANDDEVIDIHSIAHYDPEKNFVFGIIHDITERKRSEAAQRRLSAAVEQTADGIVVTDASGIIQYTNPAVQKITGYNSLELIGQNPRIFKSGQHDQSFYKDLWENITAGKVWSGTLVNKKKDGTIYHEATTISPVYNKSGNLINFVAIKHDMTQHLDLMTQLFQAQKMEAVGILAGGFAHDFNNLLQVVHGYSELMLSDKTLSSRHRENLGKIYQATTSGAQLIRGMMGFSRKIHVKFKPVNLNRIVEQIRSLLTRSIPKMIEIELFVANDLSSINGEPTQIEQILMNLAINAKDAMPDGGRLAIETQNIVLDEEYCRIHLIAKPGRYVLISVTDTGTGMDEETAKRIFEPFFTTKAPGQGTGLGLSVVYQIVEQYGGKIFCYSKPSVGTTFKIYFPAIEEIQDSNHSETEEPPKGQSETILVVDDEPNVTELVSGMLTEANYKVITASNGKEALDLYEKHQEQIKLVILDLNMPVMDGRQCLEALLSMNSNVKAIIASGYSANGTVKRILETGAKGFIDKPFDRRRVLEKIRKTIDED